MEKVAYELYKHLSTIADVKLISYGGPQKLLPLLLPYFYFKSCWVLLTNRINVVYLQDGLLAPIGLFLKIFGKPVAITIHGLDITFDNIFYQFITPRCVKRLDKIICISEATKHECIKRGIPENKLYIIPNGISDDYYISEDKMILRGKLKRELNLPLKDKKILLSVGRLVERKGFYWFIGEVVPKLFNKRNDFVYLIVGDGKLREKIKELIYKNDLLDCVFMLGQTDDQTLKLLFNISDVFIIPNIPVKGDIEGFGIVALEAASCGLPVIASRLEGLKDAIVEGKNGFLVRPYNINEFTSMIIKIIESERDCKFSQSIRDYTITHFDWEWISKSYLNCFKNEIK
jgi:glycosyltransferase involved in cell wall biosynthesis